MTKPIALDDLTKDELIQLVRERFPFVTQADLLRAKWDASTARWKRLEAEIQKIEAPLAGLVQTISTAKTAREKAKALDAFRTAHNAARAARAKADREYARGEALYARLTSTDNMPRRRRA